MSSSVCQGLQSCLDLEPRHVKPRVLIQNLSPQKSTLSQSTPNTPQPHHDNNHNIIFNNHYLYSFRDPKHQKKMDSESFWSSITKNKAPMEASHQMYVHPLSSSTLSTKSLEMCTESLGSETGSSSGESIDDFPSSPVPERSNLEGIQKSSRPPSTAKTISRSASFPPPLTSISGSEGVQVRPHREEGRLVLKAFSVTSPGPYFQAERSNGRLRLSLLKGDVEEEEDDGNVDVMRVDDEAGNGDVDESCNLCVGVGELGRRTRRRCKEGGRRNEGIPIWEPFWVTIFLKG